MSIVFGLQTPDMEGGLRVTSDPWHVNVDDRVEATKYENDGVSFRVSGCDHMGNKMALYGSMRIEQQDAYSVVLKGNSAVALVVDGHGTKGGSIARAVVQQMPDDYIRLSSWPAAFAASDAYVNPLLPTNKFSGACVVAVCATVDKVEVAWAGDSRLTCIDAAGDAVNLTEDHRPDSKKETERITRETKPPLMIRKDGQTTRLFSRAWECGTMVTRGVGNEGLRPSGFTNVPEVVTRDMKAPYTVFLYSDGVADVFNTAQDIQVFANHIDGEFEATAPAFIKACIEARQRDGAPVTMDNLSMVAIRVEADDRNTSKRHKHEHE